MRLLAVGVEICCPRCCISMGDGCVACVPSQQIMEQFSMCGGNKSSSNSNATGNNTPDVATATPAKITSKCNKTVKMKPKTKIKRRKTKTSAASVNKESLDGRNPRSCISNNISNNTSVTDVHYRPLSSSSSAAAATIKDEVEEGELGTMDVDNQGPFPRKLELKSEIEKGEFVPPWKLKWRKREEAEKTALYSGSFRGSTNDRERCRRSEVVAKDEHGVSRTRTGKDKALRGDCDETPPSSAKYSSDKDLNRSGNQHAKRPSRYECTSTHDKTHKLSSKIIHEDGTLKSELSNGKNNGREYMSGKKVKRPGMDSEISARKIGGEYDDYASSKSRKLSDGDGHSVFYTEKYSRSLMERSFRNSSTFSNGSSDRYSSSNYKSSMSSRNFYDKRNGSPRHPERSPHDRSRYHDHRDWSPARRDKSPYDRGHHWSPSRRDHSQSPYSRGRFYDPCRSPYSRGRYYDHRNQSPSYPDHSPHDGDPYHDRRDGTPNFLEQCPLDWSRTQETIRKSGTTDKQLDYQKSKGQEDKPNQTDPSGKESKNLGKDLGRSSLDNRDGPTNRIRNDQVEKGKAYEDPNVNPNESFQDNGYEDMASMEEDMDICNTPPHVPVVADASTGKWYYIDNFGVECGPSKLCELKTLVDEGYLVSDHFIKHSECERWVTVENAVSPSVNTNFPSIVPDSVTKLASPPEVPGNMLADNGDPVQSSYETSATPSKSALSLMGSVKVLQTVEDLRIDERVGAFLEGVTVFPGKELETVGEVLQLTFEYDVLEKFGNNEGECLQSMSMRLSSQSEDDADSGSTLLEPSDKDSPIVIPDIYGVFSGLWSCKGGDWRRNDDVAQDRFSRKKLVLNDGFPLCQMPKSGYEDPRWQRKEELYYPLLNRKLELPAWAFTPPDEWNDRSNESKPVGPRGGRGTILPVIRINVCVVKDHGSFVSDARMKVKGKEKYSSKASHSFSSADDMKTSSEDGVSCFKHMHGQDSHGLSKRNISIPKDHVCTATELQLHLGDWFYLDGSGHEHGPLTFMELQALAGQGAIQKSSSVFRKVDRIWVPLSCYAEDSGTAVRAAKENKTTLSNIYASRSEGNAVSSIFHDLHPQFIGYTRGKLHEFVMKSYKSREFAAAINEFLDPWINARQPKKEMESSSFFQKSGQYRAKRAKLNDSEGEFDLEDEFFSVKDECSFDELCGDETFDKEYYSQSELAGESWGSLEGHVLARIFHFLRTDLKSLVKVSLTCKSWRSAVRFYKSKCLQVDLCSVANSCNDSTICGLLNEYNKEKLRTLLIRGCFNITSGVLEEVLQLFPQLSVIDIRSCSQLDDLTSKYPRINWVTSHSKIKSLKQIDDATSSALSICSVNTQMDDFSGLRNYLESSEKRESANQLFHRSLYRRSKLFDAKKSSTILSRDAHLRRLAMRKYDHGYKKMAEFLASSLKDIMKQNSFEYFVPKVARIEGRIRNGYYAGRGLSSIKEDIRRMCRDAIKLKNRGNASDMNRIISLFIRLATSLDGGSVPWKDDSPPGFSSASSKYKKVFSKGTDKKFTNRSNRFISNGISDFGEHASDREIRRRLSKLNRKPVDSGSETSEDFDRSSDKYSSDSESTASDTESDSEAHTGSGLGESNGDVYSPLDDGLDSLADDREWGARMTEASLVPPVTRKYEVIDHYVIVADEGEVKRKMQVSLPDNYSDKLIAQRNGTEESDMEIPEVKDYKPRKQLGDEVIEQEVYGIDPYTHNLLLDSMPEDSDWSLFDKHTFIEDVVLRTLNKQVRHFTGSGSVPMTYSLKPVFDEIEEIAVEENDWRTIRLCQYILKAIDTRLEDKYVAYRKGLGVVCNKKGGFSKDDFVVEFLGEVYPAWKWFEKQDGIRSLQKNSNDPAPEFYNIHLERPKGDADGYDLVVVDAMHKANYASRICHSCRPNCEAKVTAVDGQYQIGIYTLRPIRDGEEVTFDYNSVTESKEEYEASVCLCGTPVCRGSYLNLTGEEAFQKVLIEYHGIINRLCLMLEACELNSVSDEDLIDLGKAGLGSCLLGGLPDWLISYSARLVRFINFERTKLPDEILKHNVEEKKKYFSDVCLEVEKCDAEVQAEGVYNQRLQNLAITLDKVRYVMKCVFGDPKKAPPPLERLRPEAVISLLWKGEGSLVEELIQCITPHVMDDSLMRNLKTSIRAHDPSGFDDTQGALQRSLKWLRDEVRNLPCTYKCRNDAAADLIHVFAYTKCFFKIREYKSVTSPPLYISPLDLGPKYADKVGSRGHEYSKTYGENYCLGQLIFWHIQTYSDPDSSLARAGRGCLCLPDIGSFYAKVQKPSRQRVYGPRTLKFMLSRMEKQPQRPWPKDRIWTFTSSPKVLGTPMVDAVLNKAPMDKEMIHWLKNRPPIFQAMWDR